MYQYNTSIVTGKNVQRSMNSALLGHRDAHTTQLEFMSSSEFQLPST